MTEPVAFSLSLFLHCVSDFFFLCTWVCLLSFLSFTVKPTILEELSTLEVKPQMFGEQQKLTCSAYGFPSPNITWFWQPCRSDPMLKEWVTIIQILTHFLCYDRLVKAMLPLGSDLCFISICFGLIFYCTMYRFNIPCQQSCIHDWVYEWQGMNTG